MFDNWLPKKVDDVIPEALRAPFEKKFLVAIRRELRDEDIAIQESIPGLIAPILAEIQELERKLEAENWELAEAERRVRDAEADRVAALNRREKTKWTLFDLRSQVESLESRQARHCSPLLPDFVREMTNKWLDEIRLASEIEERPGKKDSMTGKPTPSKFHTNAPAVMATIDYIKRAIEEARRMMSEPIGDEEVKIRLNALRKDIPNHRVFTLIEGTPLVWPKDEYQRYSQIVERPSF